MQSSPFSVRFQGWSQQQKHMFALRGMARRSHSVCHIVPPSSCPLQAGEDDLEPADPSLAVLAPQLRVRHGNCLLTHWLVSI